MTIKRCFLTTLRRCHCDLFGQFSKFLTAIFLTKVTQIFVNFLGLFWWTSLLIGKTTVASLGATFWNNGIPFIPTSDHTDCCMGHLIYLGICLNDIIAKGHFILRRKWQIKYPLYGLLNEIIMTVFKIWYKYALVCPACTIWDSYSVTDSWKCYRELFEFSKSVLVLF